MKIKYTTNSDVDGYDEGRTSFAVEIDGSEVLCLDSGDGGAARETAPDLVQTVESSLPWIIQKAHLAGKNGEALEIEFEEEEGETPCEN